MVNELARGERDSFIIYNSGGFAAIAIEPVAVQTPFARVSSKD